MSSPFDYVNSVSFSKEYMITDERTEHDYVPFLTNKALSYHLDAIYHCNEMNKLHHLEKKLQYDYYINTLRRRKRFSKWFKPSEDSNIELVCEHYRCNKSVAKQYLKILTEQQLKIIKEQEEKGGVK